MNRKTSQIRAAILLLLLAVAQCFYFLVADELLKTKLAYTISTFIFYVLLGSFSKKWLRIFIIFSFFVACFVFPTLQIYGKIGYNYISAIFYTNISESLSYLNLLDSSIYIPLLLLGVYSFYLVRICSKFQLSNKMKIALLGVLIAIPLLRIFIPYETRLHQCFYVLPINKVLKISDFYADVVREKEFIAKQSQQKDSWKINSQPEQNPNKNIVVVIGESVRKDFLHSYGFPIANTPFIDSSKHIQFNNYFAVNSHTVGSLLRTICLSNDLLNYEIGNNIISLSKKLGYKTFWISNQGMLGKVNSPVSIIGLQADSSLFLTKDEYSSHSDTEMLPHLYEILKDTHSPKMIVLHMFGSHPSVCDRTGGEYDEFIGSEELSCYNKSIRNTDTFLKNVYEALANSGQDFDLLYFSDHGLKISDKKLLVHAEDVKEVYAVPLLLWSNKITASQNINALRTAKDFLHLFSEIAGVQTENIKWNYQFISEDKNDDNAVEIYNNNRILNYNDLKNNPVRDFYKEKQE